MEEETKNIKLVKDVSYYDEAVNAVDFENEEIVPCPKCANDEEVGCALCDFTGEVTKKLADFVNSNTHEKYLKEIKADDHLYAPVATCPDCKGEGYIDCPDCDGTCMIVDPRTARKIDCPTCCGTGAMECETCDRMGSIAV